MPTHEKLITQSTDVTSKGSDKKYNDIWNIWGKNQSFPSVRVPQ